MAKKRIVAAQVFYIAGNSYDKEINRSINNDIYLIVIAVFVFITFALVAMTR
jgi:hypothetical protein